MKLLKTCGRAGLLLLSLLVLSVPALAAAFTEDGAPLDWTEETDRTDYYETAPVARAALTRLDTPTELEWGVDYHHFAQGAEEGVGRRREIPGMFSWKLGALRQYHYKVCVYRRDEGGDTLVDMTESWYGGDQDGNVERPDGSRRASCFRFLLEDRESGDYYFTVQALGDGNSYESSATAVSGVWHYEKNPDRLKTPARPVYDEDRELFVWTPDGGGLALWGGYVRYYFSPDPDTEPVETGKGSVYLKSPDGERLVRISDLALEESGSGWYSVRVRTISGNLDLLDSSAWSERSAPVYMESGSAVLKALVENLTESASASEKQAAVDAVRQMNTRALADLMAADRENTGAAGDIARLEELAGTRASVEVSESLKAVLDPSQISAAGAGLNVDVGQKVSLKVGEPDPNAILPTMYGNTLQFSMGLENGAGNVLVGMLAVPVKITLPLPGYINPDYLVILHHHSDGTYEEVFEPYVRQEDGQWLATFVVRSFSTFTLAEQRVSASQVPTGAEVSLVPEALEGARACLCALYDKNGQLLGIRTAELNGERQVLAFACETSAPDHGSVIYLDGEFRPAGEAESFTVIKG